MLNLLEPFSTTTQDWSMKHLKPQKKPRETQFRSHLGSRAISCSNVHGDFPVHERFFM